MAAVAARSGATDRRRLGSAGAGVLLHVASADDRGWVSAYGPFNSHLVVDAGAGFFATGVGLAAAAWLLRRPAVVVTLLAYLGWGRSFGAAIVSMGRTTAASEDL